MTTPNERIIDEVNSVTECCVCLDQLRDPRALPCIHTFCLQCLRHLTRHKLPGDRVSCPLCNQWFTIPADGVAGLPGNPLVSRLLQIGKDARAQGSKGQEVQESSDRRELRRNAYIASRLEADMIKCLQVSAKVINGVLEKHKTLKGAIVKKIEDLNFLFDDLNDQIQRKLDVLKDERFELDGHLANLASYKSYCLELAQKGTASEVTKELDILDKRRQELEEFHEPTIRREFDRQQKLLDEMVLDSVLSCRLLNTTTENVQNEDSWNRGYSTEEAKEPDRKRPRYDVSDAGGNQNFSLNSQILSNYNTPQRNQVGGDLNTNSSCSANHYPPPFDSSHTPNTSSNPLANIRYEFEINRQVSDAGVSQNFPLNSQILGDYNTPQRNQVGGDLNTNSSCSANQFPPPLDSSHTSETSSDPLANIRYEYEVDGSGTFTYFDSDSSADDDYLTLDEAGTSSDEAGTSSDSTGPSSDNSASTEESVPSVNSTSSDSSPESDPDSTLRRNYNFYY